MECADSRSGGARECSVIGFKEVVAEWSAAAQTIIELVTRGLCATDGGVAQVQSCVGAALSSGSGEESKPVVATWQGRKEEAAEDSAKGNAPPKAAAQKLQIQSRQHQRGAPVAQGPRTCVRLADQILPPPCAAMQAQLIDLASLQGYQVFKVKMTPEGVQALKKLRPDIVVLGSCHDEVDSTLVVAESCHVRSPSPHPHEPSSSFSLPCPTSSSA